MNNVDNLVHRNANYHRNNANDPVSFLKRGYWRIF